MTLQSIGFKFFTKIIKGIYFFAIQVVLALTLQATLENPSGSNNKVLITFRIDVFTGWREHVPRKRKQGIKHCFQILLEFLVKPQTRIGS